MSKPSGSRRSVMPRTADFIAAGTNFGKDAGRLPLQAAEQQRACRPACGACRHLARPGMAAGYCGAGRPDLALAYGVHHPLRRLPADRGAGCAYFIAREQAHDERGQLLRALRSAPITPGLADVEDGQ